MRLSSVAIQICARIQVTNDHNRRLGVLLLIYMRKIITASLLCLHFIASAQSKRLQVGERFDYTFVNLINYAYSTANVSDFRGKVLILVFWNTGCASCISNWQNLLYLQEKFAESVQIMLVNSHQGESVVRRTIAQQREKNNVNMTLPSVCQDTILSDVLFPYPGVPKVVWIDQRGVFRSFTSSDWVNETTIQRILARDRLLMHQLPSAERAQDIYFNYENSKLSDIRKPLFVNGNGHNSAYMPLVTQSVLTGKIDGLIPVFYEIEEDSLSNRVTVTMHGSISTMYRVAYNDRNFADGSSGYSLEWLLDNRVEWNSSNENFEKRRRSGEANYGFWYCYQLTTKSTTRRRIQGMIKLDLEKYFGLYARMEKRLMQCLVLSSTDKSLIERNRTTQDPSRGVFMFRSSDHLVYFLSYGDYNKAPYPIINEIDLDGSLGGVRVKKDHRAFDRELRKVGLSITLEERYVDVLVVDEPPDYEFPLELVYEGGRNVLEWKYQ